jgi:hypothetical protein
MMEEKLRENAENGNGSAVDDDGEMQTGSRFISAISCSKNGNRNVATKIKIFACITVLNCLSVRQKIRIS